MKRRELEELDLGELMKLAKKHKIPVKKGMDRQAVVDAVHAAIGIPEEEPARTEEEHVHSQDMQQAVEESRFYTGQPAKEEAPAVPPELPHHYNDDRIALAVRDPYWAYAYWEVTRRKLEAEKGALGEEGHGAHLALRVYDVTDIDFDGNNAHGYNDIGIYERVGSWYIHTDMPGRSFVVDLGLKTPYGRFITLARSNAIRTPRDRASDVLDEEWVMAEQDYRRIFALSGGYGVGLSSAELAHAAGRRVPFGAASPGMGSLALMSPAMRKKERGFWFVLNTELIVYGATEPDASVKVQGRPIELRPDGTFTLRFALPDGTQVIPVSATSADRAETLSITPEVTRDTKTSETKAKAA